VGRRRRRRRRRRRKNDAALLKSTITTLEVVSSDVKKFTLYPNSKLRERSVSKKCS